MAKVIPIGEPVNDSEKQAIAHLRDVLPENYLLLHNFEIHRHGHIYEVDLALLTPHAVYLVDVKGTRGLIDVYGPKWYPEGRTPFASPLAKLRGHAKSLKGMITDSHPSRRELQDIYVDAVVLLTARDATLQDPGGRDAPNVTTLARSAAFFQNAGRIPHRKGGGSKNISRHHNLVLKTLDAKARPQGPLRFKNWEVLEKLGATSTYTDYRAFNTFDGKRDNTVLLRAYQETDRCDKAVPVVKRELFDFHWYILYCATIANPVAPGILGLLLRKPMGLQFSIQSRPTHPQSFGHRISSATGEPKRFGKSFSFHRF